MKGKRKLPPHIVLPDGRWRFIKQGSKKRTVVKSTAKHKTFSKAGAKAFYNKGQTKYIIEGALAGALGQIASKYLGTYGHPAATIATGFLMKNNILITEGSREGGAILASMVPFLGGGGENIGNTGGRY